LVGVFRVEVEVLIGDCLEAILIPIVAIEASPMIVVVDPHLYVQMSSFGHTYWLNP